MLEAMEQDDLDYYLKHSEHKSDPPRRLLLEFESSGNAVILLNDNGLPLLTHADDLVGKSFRPSSKDQGMLELEFPGLAFENSPLTKQKAWRLHYDGDSLLIFSRKATTKHTLPDLGTVIAGKVNIPNGKIKAARVLSKSEPTPFIKDKWGDSYNDSYYLEPRTVDTVPSTVFNAVNNIMNCGKDAFKQGDFEAAAAKYQKAFHYCHSYYPEDLEDEDLNTATVLKMQSLLNLALAGIKCKSPSRLSQAVESCDFILEMPEAADSHKAKAYYRRGQANLERGDEDLAQKDFESSLALLDDPATHRAIELCAQARNERQKNMKARLKNAFK